MGGRRCTLRQSTWLRRDKFWICAGWSSSPYSPLILQACPRAGGGNRSADCPNPRVGDGARRHGGFTPPFSSDFRTWFPHEVRLCALFFTRLEAIGLDRNRLRRIEMHRETVAKKCRAKNLRRFISEI